MNRLNAVCAILYYATLLGLIVAFVYNAVMMHIENKQYSQFLEYEAMKLEGINLMDIIKLKGTISFEKEPGETEQTAKERLLRILHDLGLIWEEEE